MYTLLADLEHVNLLRGTTLHKGTSIGIPIGHEHLERQRMGGGERSGKSGSGEKGQKNQGKSGKLACTWKKKTWVLKSIFQAYVFYVK